MLRRDFIKKSGITGCGLLIYSTKIFSRSFQQPWKITMLRNSIGIFEERGGTIGFYLSKKGIVVIDSQFPDQSRHLIDELRKKTDKPFKILINTHHHGDHTAGNVVFKGIVKHVVAHKNSKVNQENTAKQNKTEDKQLLPDITFESTWSQKTGNERITAKYYGPAHTNGDSIIHFENANIVHCGDLIFNRRHPFVDRAAGASIKNWISVLNKLLQQFDKETIFIFGHAAPGYQVTGNLDDVRLFRNYLENVIQFTSSAIQSGKTKEEFLKSVTIPGSEEWKGEGIQRPLSAAWDELSEKAST